MDRSALGSFEKQSVCIDLLRLTAALCRAGQRVNQSVKLFLFMDGSETRKSVLHRCVFYEPISADFSPLTVREFGRNGRSKFVDEISVGFTEVTLRFYVREVRPFPLSRDRSSLTA